MLRHKFACKGMLRHKFAESQGICCDAIVHKQAA